MSKVLFITFNPGEEALGANFAADLGVSYDWVHAGSEGTADSLAKAIAQLASEYSHLASVSSMASKDVMARVAGILDIPMVTDAIAAQSPTQFKRPIVAGTLIESVEVLAPRMVVTFRPAGFASSDSAPEKTLALESVPSKATRLQSSSRSGGRPDLTQAKVVVSGGRPLKDAETFERVIGGLADALGGAVGATRAAVDSGIAANELQVGQTGKIVAPDLYIAAGISGSTQHMAGIKDSKVIVAINKDADAPIFEAADIGLVADLYDVIPALQEKLGK